MGRVVLIMEWVWLKSPPTPSTIISSPYQLVASAADVAEGDSRHHRPACRGHVSCVQKGIQDSEWRAHLLSTLAGASLESQTTADAKRSDQGNRLQWVTLTFDLAFRWAKVWSKYRLKSKSKVILLSESLRPKFRPKYILRLKLSQTNRLKSVEFAW